MEHTNTVALKLLASGAPMLHDFSDRGFCVYCGLAMCYSPAAQECDKLLRRAVEILEEKVQLFEEARRDVESGDIERRDYDNTDTRG